MLPIFYEKSATPAMMKHSLQIVKDLTGHLNPGQIPVIAGDQHLYIEINIYSGLVSDPKSSSCSLGYAICENGTSYRKSTIWRISLSFFLFKGLKASTQQNFAVWACLRPWIVFLHLRPYHVWKWDIFLEIIFLKIYFFYLLRFKSLCRLSFWCLRPSQTTNHLLTPKGKSCVKMILFFRKLFFYEFSYFWFFKVKKTCIHNFFYVWACLQP